MSYPPEFERIYATTTSKTFVTVLDITGSGIIDWALFKSTTDTGEFRITIDGYTDTVTIAAGTTYALGLNADASVTNIFSVVLNYNAYHNLIWFQDNLLVEHRVVAGTVMSSKILYGVL